MRSRFHLINEAKETLSRISKNKNNVYFIHYSCESFYDIKGGLSPKIASISIKNFESEQTHSYSIHQFAEQEGYIDIKEIESNYLKIEFKMLEAYFNYVRILCKNQNSDIFFLHWNMNNSTFGFVALENRFKVLKGKPFSIPDSRKINIPTILHNLFGDNYIENPKLESIIEYNNYSKIDFIKGEGEAECFKKGEYYKLHKSTSKKVAIFTYVINDIMIDKIKTKSNYFKANGITFKTFTNFLTENSISKILIFVFAILGFISLFKPIQEIINSILKWLKFSN